MTHRPLVSALPAHPFRVAHALALGETPDRLRGADLLRPHRGVRSRAVDRSLSGLCLEALPLLGVGQTFSHVTAAGLWGLPLPPRLRVPSDVHVASPDSRRPRRPGIVGHRVGSIVMARAGPFPVVEPVMAWLQCGALLEVDELVAMGDSLAGRWPVFGGAGNVPVETLEAAVAAWGSRRGATSLREAVTLVRSGCRSPGETRLRLLLQRAGLPEPHLNEPVCDAVGREIGTPDLAYPWCRIAVEYEGDYHRVDPEAFAKDIRRRERFADAGWRTIRVTKSDLNSHEAELVARVRRHVRAPPR